MQCHFVFLGIFEIQCFTCAFEDMQGDHCKLYCPDHSFFIYFTLLLLHPSPRGTFVFRNNLDVKTHLFKAFLVIYLVRARFSFDLKCSSREYKAYHPLFMGCSVLTDVRLVTDNQPFDCLAFVWKSYLWIMIGCACLRTNVFFLLSRARHSNRRYHF